MRLLPEQIKSTPSLTSGLAVWEEEGLRGKSRYFFVPQTQEVGPEVARGHILPPTAGFPGTASAEPAQPRFELAPLW